MHHPFPRGLVRALFFLILLTPNALHAQGPRYVEASTLTLTGKMMDTPNPYWRVDTTRFKGFTQTESNQIHRHFFVVEE